MPFCLEQAQVKRRRHRQITLIPTGSIHASASTEPDGELDALKHSIARLGLLSPILVRLRGDGYELVAGARRLAACRALGMEELECIVLPALNEECLLAALCENQCRRAPDPERLARIRRELERAHGYTPSALDALSGCIAPDLPRRSAHGYIRDERLIVNAARDLVSNLRNTGMDARLNVRTQGEGLLLEIAVPCAMAGRCTRDCDKAPSEDNLIDLPEWQLSPRAPDSPCAVPAQPSNGDAIPNVASPARDNATPKAASPARDMAISQTGALLLSDSESAASGLEYRSRRSMRALSDRRAPCRDMDALLDELLSQERANMR